MSSSNWLHLYPHTGTQSKLNGMIVLRDSDGGQSAINSLVNILSGFNLDEFLGFTAIQDVLHSITYYPINLELGPTFQAGTVTVNGRGIYNGSQYLLGREFNHDLYSCGMFLGQFFVPSSNSYTDYEPYCKTTVWLPYCGLIELPRSKIVGKYVSILLYIDFNTGNAQYVIGTGTRSFDNPRNEVFLYNTDIGISEIIATEDFVIGYKYPIATTGYNDYLRNTAIGLAKTAIGIYGASTYTPASLVPKEKVVTNQVRNPKTGRLIISDRTTTKESVSDSSIKNYRKSSVSQAMYASIGSLAQNQMQGSVSNTNNPMVMYGTTQSVKVITTRSNLVEYTDAFDATYGRPLGETRRIGDLSGFIDLSSIKLEGDGFNRATSEEMDLLETIMVSGVRYTP